MLLSIQKASERLAPRGLCPFLSLLPLPFSRMTSRLPKTDGTSLTTPHAFTATRSARFVTRISPPAPRVPRPSSGNGFLRRRRVLVELRSLVGTRQKPIRAGSLPSRPVPTLRDTHCPTPTHLVLAIPVPQGSRLPCVSTAPDAIERVTSVITETGLASCNGVRVSPDPRKHDAVTYPRQRLRAYVSR